jgi:hypothetical protein
MRYGKGWLAWIQSERESVDHTNHHTCTGIAVVVVQPSGYATLLEAGRGYTMNPEPVTDLLNSLIRLGGLPPFCLGC